MFSIFAKNAQDLRMTPEFYKVAMRLGVGDEVMVDDVTVRIAERTEWGRGAALLTLEDGRRLFFSAHSASMFRRKNYLLGFHSYPRLGFRELAIGDVVLQRG